MLKLAYDKLKLLKHLQPCNTTDLQNNFKNQWSSPLIIRVKKASGFEYCHGSWCWSWLWRSAIIVTGFSLWAFEEDCNDTLNGYFVKKLHTSSTTHKCTLLVEVTSWESVKQQAHDFSWLERANSWITELNLRLDSQFLRIKNQF